MTCTIIWIMTKSCTRIASRLRPISRGTSTPNQAQFIAVARTIEVDSSSPSESLDLGIT